jgi:predicted PurR-regulated permease PerM
VSEGTRAWRAAQVAVATVVALALVAAALALWKLRVILALAFLGVTLAAAIRSGVERLARWGIARPIGVLVHYAAALGVIALFLWLAVPAAIRQISHAVESSSRARPDNGGLEDRLLFELQRQLHHLPPASELWHPALTASALAWKVLISVLFMLAVATYWVFERDRAIGFVTSVVPASKRPTARATWLLIDRRLGAYIRGVLFLVLLVSTLLSLIFWLLGVPYWLLLGPFAGVIEILPVIGPLIAGVTAVAVALSVSWQLAVKTAVAFYVFRLLQDYVINPRVLGGAVELSPLVVLVAVSSVGILLGAALVPLATPLAAVAATLVDVVVRGRDPTQENASA